MVAEEDGEEEKEMLWSQRISRNHYKTGDDEKRTLKSIESIRRERKQ